MRLSFIATRAMGDGKSFLPSVVVFFLIGIFHSAHAVWVYSSSPVSPSSRMIPLLDFCSFLFASSQLVSRRQWGYGRLLITRGGLVDSIKYRGLATGGEVLTLRCKSLSLIVFPFSLFRFFSFPGLIRRTGEPGSGVGRIGGGEEREG